MYLNKCNKLSKWTLPQFDEYFANLCILKLNSALVDLHSQNLNFLITGRYIILGEYHSRWKCRLIKLFAFLTVAVCRYLATTEVAYLA